MSSSNDRYGRNAELLAEREAILALPPDQQGQALIAMSQRRSGLPSIPGGFREPGPESEGGAYTEGLPPASGRYVDTTRIFPVQRLDKVDGASPKEAGDSTTSDAGRSTTARDALRGITGISPGQTALLGGRLDLIDRDVALARRQGDIEQSQRRTIAQGEADASRGFAESQRRSAQELERRLQPIPEFVATRETAGDIGSLASLLMVAGAALGGKGKQGALMAVQSMTGMLAGYRQGRQDLYQRERQNFETGLRQVQAQNTQLQEAFTRAQRLAQTDMEAARQQFQVEAVRLGASLPNITAERAGLAQGQQILQQAGTALSQAEAARLRLTEAKAERDRQNQVIMRQRQQAEGDAAVDLSERLKRPDEPTGPYIRREQARAINSATSAMGEAYGIADEVSRHPTLFGRQGQVAAAYQRWVTSLGSGEPNATLSDSERGSLNDQEQAALVAAKRYYAFLVGYENAIAGSGNRATVQLRQQFNSLMNPNQFSQDGMLNLLRDHTRTMAQTAAQNAGSGRITYDVLRDAAIRDYANTTFAQDRDSAARGARVLGVTQGGRTTTQQAPDLSQFLGAPQ
jgi:hypothetical protein